MAESYNLGSAVLSTQIDLGGLNKGLSEAESMTKGSLESAASGGLGIFQSVFAVGLGNLISGAIQGLTSSVSGMFSTMIDEAQAAERTQAQLGAVLESTGGKAGVTADMANEYAASIQKLTPISDDAVIAGENMLLTFTNIGKDVFPQATQTMVDMATSMNGGATPSAEQLSKTAIMLGKALGDPVAGASALRKVGVALTDQQGEQIKAFVASGDAMSAQKLILNELSTEFGGSAAASAKTYSGQMEMLKNTFLDVAETAGGPLIASMGSVTGALMNPAVVGALTNLATTLTSALGGAITYVAGMLPDIISSVAGMVTTFTALATSVGATWTALTQAFTTGGIAGVAATIQADLASVGTSMTTWLRGMASAIATNIVAWGQSFTSWIVPAIPSLLAALGNLSANLLTWLIGVDVAIVSKLLTWGQAFVAWIAPTIPPLLAALGQLATSFVSWVLAQQAALVAKLAAWATAFVMWVTPAIPPLLNALGQLASQFMTWLAAQVPPLLAKLQLWGQQFVAWVGPVVGPLLSALGALASQLLNWAAAQLPPIMAKLLAWGQQFVAWVAPQISPMLSMLANLAYQFFNWLAAQVAPLLAKLQIWGQQFIAWIVPMTATFLAQWPGFLSRFLDWIGAQAGPLLVKLGTWAAQFVAWIIPMIPPFLVALAGVAVAILAWVVSTAAVLIVKLLQWAKAFQDFVMVQVLPKLPGWLHEIDTAMWAWADKAKEALYNKVIDIGTQLVEGIKKGVKDAWSSFMGWIHDQIEKIPEPIRDALGIHSPSEVMAATVGMPIVHGIIEGIQRAYPMLDQTMKGLAGKIEGPMQAMADFAHQTMQGILDSNVSGARQAVSNFDQMSQMQKAAIAQRDEAVKAVSDAQVAFNQVVKEQAEAVAKAQNDAAAAVAKAQAEYDAVMNKANAGVAEAHDKYATAIANTEDAITLLNQKLDAAKAGTIAYQAIQDQIAANERKLADLRATQSEAEAKAREAAAVDAAAAAEAEKKLADAKAAAAAAFANAQATQAKALSDAQLNVEQAQMMMDRAMFLWNATQARIQQAQTDLAAATAQATEISKTNAQAGADYLAMRSRQILELEQLEQDKQNALANNDSLEYQRLATKEELVKQAQASELAQYKQHADDLITAVQKQVADIAQQGRDAGDSFLQGMIDGLVAGTNALGDAMTSAVMVAIAAVKKALDIKSPSRLAALQIGQPLAEGMAIGVEAKAMMLSDATAKVAQQGMSSAASTVNHTYNLSASYRHQGEASLRDDITMLAMMKGRK